MFKKMLGSSLAAVLLAVFIMVPASAGAFFSSFFNWDIPSWDDFGGQEVVVYVGEAGADTYEQSLEGVLYTQDQIGIMADRILWTQGEIADMSDRIVYVTEISEDNSLEVLYVVTDSSFLMMDGFWSAYDTTLETVENVSENWFN